MSDVARLVVSMSEMPCSQSVSQGSDSSGGVCLRGWLELRASRTEQDSLGAGSPLPSVQRQTRTKSPCLSARHKAGVINPACPRRAD
jgi:hypothetical protein